MAVISVKCQYCGEQVGKIEAIRYKNKNYHVECAKLQESKDKLTDYICMLFGFKAPGPLVYSQLKLFLEKNINWTYESIYQALYYFYEVKKGSKTKSNSGIGIVPYIYDEAQIYFLSLSQKQDKVSQVIQKQEEKETRIIKIQKKNDSKKGYNLDIIGEE